MVYILLGNGFETVEALCPCDLMRRAGIEVALTSLTENQQVTSGQHVTVTADITLDQVDLSQAELIMLPGGLGGVAEILGTQKALDLIQKAAAEEKWVCAICAAPTVLAKLGLLEGKPATVYPGMENQMEGAQTKPGSHVVQTGKIITGEAAGSSFDFGLKLVEVLRGPEAREQVRAGVHYCD